MIVDPTVSGHFPAGLMLPDVPSSLRWGVSAHAFTGMGAGALGFPGQSTVASHQPLDGLSLLTQKGWYQLGLQLGAPLDRPFYEFLTLASRFRFYRYFDWPKQWSILAEEPINPKILSNPELFWQYLHAAIRATCFDLID